MAGDLVDLLKRVVVLNLRTTTRVLVGAKDYITAMKEIVIEGQVEGQASPAPAPHAPPVAIQLVGALGETASSAFQVTNSSPSSLTVAPAIQAQGPAASARLEPPSSIVEPRADAVFRVLVEVTDDFVEGQTYGGVIAVPGLSTQAIPFTVRRVAKAPADEAAQGVASTTYAQSA